MSDGDATAGDVGGGDATAGDAGTPERADTPHGSGMPDVSVTPGASSESDTPPSPPPAPPPAAPPPAAPQPAAPPLDAPRAPRIPEPPPARGDPGAGLGFGSYLWSHPAVLAVLIVLGIVLTGAVVDNIDGDSVTGSVAGRESLTPAATSESGETPAAAAFDFAVIGRTGNASRNWTMEELDALPKRTVTAGGETVEGPSLLDLLEQSGEGDWRIVALVRTPVVPLERDSIDEDWILLFEPGVPRLTLVNPKFPRAAWFQQIVQFNIVE